MTWTQVFFKDEQLARTYCSLLYVLHDDTVLVTVVLDKHSPLDALDLLTSNFHQILSGFLEMLSHVSSTAKLDSVILEYVAPSNAMYDFVEFRRFIGYT